MNRNIADLAERYFQVCMDASPFDATTYGVRGWDAEVPDLSEAGEAETDRRLADLERRLAGIDAAGLGAEDRVTLAMLGRGLADRRAELAARWPELTVSATQSGIQTAVLGLVPKVTLATPDQADDYLERCAKLGGCLDQAGDRRAATDPRAADCANPHAFQKWSRTGGSIRAHRRPSASAGQIPCIAG